MKVNNSNNMQSVNMLRSEPETVDDARLRSASTAPLGERTAKLADRLSGVSNVDDLPGARTAASSGISAPSIHIVDESRLKEIVTQLLPENDLLFQTTYTSMINTADRNTPAFLAAEENYQSAYAEKVDLQNEAIRLFNLLNTEKTEVKDNVSLYKLLFKMSYSFEEVEGLLNKANVNDHFIRYASDERNAQGVTELYTILSSNAAASVSGELAARNAKYDQ
nr:hypothetical protein [uncultured Enterobacter sp.]